MLFFSGSHGSGKTEAARYLQSRGFVYFDTGPIIRALHLVSESKKSFVEWIGTNEAIEGVHFTDRIITQEINRRISCLDLSNINDVIIVGSRTPLGIEYYKRNILVPNSRESRIIYFESSLHILYERYVAREGVDWDFERFKQYYNDEITRTGLLEIRDSADLIISNDGLHGDLYGELESRLLPILDGNQENEVK